MQVIRRIRNAARARLVKRCVRRGPRQWARRGFTLIELLLAMTIMGLLAGIAAHPLHAALTQARNARAISEVSMLQREITMYQAEKGSLPPTLTEIGRGGMLDPWGRPYVYLPFPSAKGGGSGGGGGGGGGIAGVARKDRFLVPINSTYDLYSIGADGRSTGPLTASISQDDIIRANDGAYVGLASGY